MPKIKALVECAVPKVPFNSDPPHFLVGLFLLPNTLVLFLLLHFVGYY